MISEWCISRILNNMTHAFYEKQNEPWERAGGGSICEGCGKQYYDHKPDGPVGYNNKPFCRRLCDGRLVKL